MVAISAESSRRARVFADERLGHERHQRTDNTYDASRDILGKKSFDFGPKFIAPNRARHSTLLSTKLQAFPPVL